MYLNNATILFNRKSNYKITMSCKLVWMDEMFIQVASLCNCHLNFMPHLFFAIEILYDLSKVISANCNHMWHL